MREVNDSHVMNQSFTSMLNDACPDYDVSNRRQHYDVNSRQNQYDVAKHHPAQYDVNSRQHQYDVSSRHHQYDVTNGQQHRQHYDVTRQVTPHGNSNLHASNQMSVAGFNQNFGPSNSYQVF